MHLYVYVRCWDAIGTGGILAKMNAPVRNVWEFAALDALPERIVMPTVYYINVNDCRCKAAYEAALRAEEGQLHLNLVAEFWKIMSNAGT